MRPATNELNTFAADGSQLLQSRSPTSPEWEASFAATSLPRVKVNRARTLPEEASTTPQNAGPTRKPRAGKIRIVVADDSPVALTFVCSLLRRQPDLDVVGTAANGMEALRRVEALQPDLMLTDLEMPVFSGLDIARSVRARFPRTRIVIISMHPCPAGHEPSRASGIDGFVSKFTMDHELIPLIERLFQKSQAAEPGELS